MEGTHATKTLGATHHLLHHAAITQVNNGSQHGFILPVDRLGDLLMDAQRAGYALAKKESK